MDGVSTPRKGTPSLSSPKPSFSGSRETNENEHPIEQKVMAKNFMSPTISAASKASIPRKKILAERNENSTSCESHPYNKPSNLGSITNSLNSISHRSGKLPVSYNYGSESEDDQQNNFVVESSYKPYDHVTNCLVPRPKFLRYKPSRRHGVTLHQEDLSRYGNDDVGMKQRGPLDSENSKYNQGSLQQAQDLSNLIEKHSSEEENEDVASVEDDEEMEEFVDIGWYLKGLFKITLLFVVFFLAVSDLSSMDSMVTSHTCNIIRKNMFEAVFCEIYGSGNVCVDQQLYSQGRTLELSQEAETNYELQAVKFDGNFVGLLNVETAEMEEKTEPHKEPSAAGIDIEQDSTKVEVTHSLHGDEEETMLTTVSEVATSNDVYEEQGSQEQLQRDRVLEEEDFNQENLNLFNLGESLDDISSTSADVQYADSSDNSERAEADYKVQQVERISQESSGEQELSETELKGAEEILTEFETSNLDIGLEAKDVEVQEIGLNNTVIIVGVSAASVLLASLVIIYVSRKPKASTESPRAAGVLNPVIASVEGELLDGKTETSVVKVSRKPKTSTESPRAAGVLNPVIASVEEELLDGKTETSVVKVSSLHEPLNNPSENLRNTHLERTTAAISITQSSTLYGPRKEVSKEISHISAPNVELLGEMVVEVSSSLRSCVRKNSMIEAEESSTYLSKGKATQAQASVVDHSTADSQSYGSFKAEKKILKKKVEKDGEEVKKVVLTTPVRRSSRIRDRGVVSP